MNSLSWALYAAGVFDSLKPMLGVLAGALGPGWLLVTALQRGDAGSYPKSELWPWPKKGVCLAVVLALFACVVPSAKTVYLIAASEAGERIATTPEGREMLDLIRRKIRDALSDKA